MYQIFPVEKASLRFCYCSLFFFKKSRTIFFAYCCQLKERITRLIMKLWNVHVTAESFELFPSLINRFLNDVTHWKFTKMFPSIWKTFFFLIFVKKKGVNLSEYSIEKSEDASRPRYRFQIVDNGQAVVQSFDELFDLFICDNVPSYFEGMFFNILQHEFPSRANSLRAFKNLKKFAVNGIQFQFLRMFNKIFHDFGARKCLVKCVFEVIIQTIKNDSAFIDIFHAKWLEYLLEL